MLQLARVATQDQSPIQALGPEPPPAPHAHQEDILTSVLACQDRRAAPSVSMVDIPLAQLVHARIALPVEEVRLEVAMLITTRLWTASYVSLEDILTKVIS